MGAGTQIQNRSMIQKWGLSGSVLKWIAIVTMFIDHVGASVLYRMYASLARSLSGITDAQASARIMEQVELLGRVYTYVRQVGRIAFPIFCFLLIEGFLHTSNLKKYLVRLAVFAAVSEIPFDLAIFGKITMQHQNVFFTLFVGMMTIAVMDRIQKYALLHPGSLVQAGAFAMILASGAAGMLLANLLHTDYSAKGIFVICVFYLLHKRKAAQLVCGCLSFVTWEPTAVFAFLPMAFYNGKRGRQSKYFFYLFYPVHLIVLYLVCVLMGI